MTPSDEQQNVIHILNEGKHPIVSAVAGSGKSTTILYAATSLPERHILQLTYNASLRQEVREKVERAGIHNLEVHTYHSFAVKYYSPPAHTDTELRKIVRDKMAPRISIPPFDIICCDETQDMTLLYFRFVYKLARDSGRTFQLILLGDEKQSLYEFKGSDSRFLSLGAEIWKDHPYIGRGGAAAAEFVHTTLRTSYRITRPMAQFVNNVMLGEPRMEAARDGAPVMYIHYNKMNLENKLIFEIRNLIQNHGAKPSDFFILSGSVKGKLNNVRRMENALVEQGIPCNVPMFENESMDERVIQGKVVFSTFHSVKGRQRPFVFVVGFNQSYMDFMARDVPTEECPNTLYVACTRASNKLYLLEEDKGTKDSQLKFLKYSHHDMNGADFIDFKGLPRIRKAEAQTPEELAAAAPETLSKTLRYTTPTDLIRFIAEDILDIITPVVERLFTTEREKMPEPLNIPVVQKMRGGNYEEISDINGIAIPCIYYDYFLKKGAGTRFSSTIYSVVENEMKYLKQQKRDKNRVFEFLEQKLKNMPRKCAHISDYLYLSNIYIALKEHLYFKLFQIAREDYTWLPPATIKQSYKVIREALHLGTDFTVEQNILGYDDEHDAFDRILHAADISLFRFAARVDLITEDTVWEIKCTGDLSIEHLLQVIIYAWIWRVAGYSPKQFKILNIKTGEVRRLHTDACADIDMIVFELLKNKYKKPVRKNTEEFLEAVRAAVCEDAAIE
jgi:hypothetical protein